MSASPPTLSRNFGDAVTAFNVAAGFWTVHYLLLAFRTQMFDGFEISDGEMALRRIPIHLCGLALSLCLFAVLRTLRRLGFAWRVSVLAALVLPVAALYGFASDMLLWYVFSSVPTVPFRSIMFWQDMFPWIGSFAAWTAILLVLDHAAALRDRDRRLSEIQLLAREAQMQALRYQLNPHFLFNTLNAISSLIWEAELERAEAMVIALADFLRATLELDPTADVTLAKEVALQRQYLAIEQIRFPTRLDVRFAVPPMLEQARVPSLILQPLVENAIKYAVAPSDAQTRVRIVAHSTGGRLELTVEDDGDGRPAAAPSSTGLGLSIVRRRLAARFGEAGSLSIVAGSLTGFRATLLMPLEYT